jgi:hypothetical protein
MATKKSTIMCVLLKISSQKLNRMDFELQRRKCAPQQVNNLQRTR